jgi:hypothetical protein
LSPDASGPVLDAAVSVAKGQEPEEQQARLDGCLGDVFVQEEVGA